MSAYVWSAELPSVAGHGHGLLQSTCNKSTDMRGLKVTSCFAIKAVVIKHRKYFIKHIIESHSGIGLRPESEISGFNIGVSAELPAVT